MPFPANVTPTGNVALLAKRVYDLLKVDTDFWSWAGVADQAGAEQHLYPYHLQNDAFPALSDNSLPILMFDAPDDETDPDDEKYLGVETTQQLSTTLHFKAYKLIPTTYGSDDFGFFRSNEETILTAMLSGLKGRETDGVRLTHQGLKTVERLFAAPATQWFSQPAEDSPVSQWSFYFAMYEITFGIGGEL